MYGFETVLQPYILIRLISCFEYIEYSLRRGYICLYTLSDMVDLPRVQSYRNEDSSNCSFIEGR